MKIYDITIGGTAMHELRLSEVRLDKDDLYTFVEEPLHELSRGQLSRLDGRWRRGVPRTVPAGDQDIYVMHAERGDGWRRMHETWTDLGDAANAMILCAFLNPHDDARLLRGRKVVMIYDADTGTFVAG